MSDPVATKIYDLEPRARQFAKDVRALVPKLPRTTANFEDSKQLIRSSGSIGANYIEANEGLGSKDFLFRLKIARKEAKESRHWLILLNTGTDQSLEQTRVALVQEALELTLILTTIINKCS